MHGILALRKFSKGPRYPLSYYFAQGGLWLGCACIGSTLPLPKEREHARQSWPDLALARAIFRANVFAIEYVVCFAQTEIIHAEGSGWDAHTSI